jgi:hypothetical protein
LVSIISIDAAQIWLGYGQKNGEEPGYDSWFLSFFPFSTPSQQAAMEGRFYVAAGFSLPLLWLKGRGHP